MSDTRQNYRAMCLTHCRTIVPCVWHAHCRSIVPCV